MLQSTYQPVCASAHRASTLAEYSLAVERVIQTMRAHPTEPLSLEDMADVACLSPFHFNRVFRSIIGIPPGEFLAALRLESAKRLLLTTDLTVTDVCFEVGYTSLGTFTTRFSQLIGLPPGQLRPLADHLSHTSLALPADELSMYTPGRASTRAGVYGQISLSAPITGIIFAGLFPKAIPQSHPVAGVHLFTPGAYQIAPVPDGWYYLMVAALPLPASPLNFLLPDTVDILVGSTQMPLLIDNGRAGNPIDLTLRPLQPSDPPILIALPLLLPIRVPVRQYA